MDGIESEGEMWFEELIEEVLPEAPTAPLEEDPLDVVPLLAQESALDDVQVVAAKLKGRAVIKTVIIERSMMINKVRILGYVKQVLRIFE